MRGASYGPGILGGGGGVRSNSTYPSSGGLTVSMDTRFDSGYEPGGGVNPMIFSLTDINGGQPPAFITIFANSVTYYLTVGTQARFVTHTYTADTAFHNFAFTVDAGGNAAWRRDGALQQTAPSFPLNKNFSIKVISPGSTDTMLGSGHIDNVLVTTP